MVALTPLRLANISPTPPQVLLRYATAAAGKEEKQKRTEEGRAEEVAESS
jgi:hypothetical protein